MGVPGYQYTGPAAGYSQGGKAKMDLGSAYGEGNERPERAARRQILLGLGIPNADIRSGGLLNPARFSAYDPFGAGPIGSYGGKGGIPSGGLGSKALPNYGPAEGGEDKPLSGTPKY